MSPHEESQSGTRPISRGQIIRKNVALWRLFFLVVLCAVFLLLLWKAIPVLLLLFAGALAAIAFRVVSDHISKWTRIPARVSLTLVLVVVLGGGAVGAFFAWPTVSGQLHDLVNNLREALSEIGSRMQRHSTGVEILEWLSGIGENYTGGTWTMVAGFFTTTIGALAGFGMTLVIGIFLAYNPALYVRGFLRLIPITNRSRAYEIIAALSKTLRWWMAAQLISMVFLAVTTWAMLSLVGVPMALTLALMTGLLTFVPYLGPVIAMVPILLVSLAESPSLMFTVLVLYLIIQNLEANVLLPIVMQRTVHLPPVLTIVAQVLLGAVFGLAGVILATPLLAVGIVLVQMIYVEDLLGDSMKRPVQDRIG